MCWFLSDNKAIPLKRASNRETSTLTRSEYSTLTNGRSARSVESATLRPRGFLLAASIRMEVGCGLESFQSLACLPLSSRDNAGFFLFRDAAGD